MIVNDKLVIDLFRLSILFFNSFKNIFKNVGLLVRNFIKSFFDINIISLEVDDITVAGYSWLSENAITSPNKFPRLKEDK